MNKYPSIRTVAQVINSANTNAVFINGKYVPARSEGFMSMRSRIRCAWLVFTGKADALLWEGQ